MFNYNHRPIRSWSKLNHPVIGERPKLATRGLGSTVGGRRRPVGEAVLQYLGSLGTWALNLKLETSSSLLTPSLFKRQQKKCKIKLQTKLNRDLLNMYASSISTCPCAEGAQISLNQRS